MATMTLERALEVIRTTGCSRMAAYDSANFPIDHVEAETVAQLCDEITDLIGNTSGTVRLECWAPAPPKVPGTRKAEQPKTERFVFHVRGLLGATSAPANRTEPARVDEMTGTVDVRISTAVTMARQSWELEQLRTRLAELSEPDDDDDDDDQDEPPAPANAGLFGMSPEQTFQVLGGLKELVAPLLQPLAGRPITGQPAAPALTETEQRLMAAFKRFAAAQPDQAHAIASELLTNFGEDKPAPDDDPKG